MSEDHLLYSVDHGIATITFNRPDLTPAKLSDFFKLVA